MRVVSSPSKAKRLAEERAHLLRRLRRRRRGRVVGEIFSGEKAQHLREGLNKLATHATHAKTQATSMARSLLGGLSSLSLRPRDETAASTSTDDDAAAPPAAEPPQEVGAFFREAFSFRR